MSLWKGYLEDIFASFDKQKQIAEKAFRQVEDEGFFKKPGEQSNSIAVIIKHVAGNLASRWTDFLATDGDTPWRDRNGEFTIGPDDTRPSLLAAWEAGWTTLFQSLRSLTEADLLKKVTIRNEEHGLPGDPSLFDSYRLPRWPNRVPVEAGDQRRLGVDRHSAGPKPAGESQGWAVPEVTDRRSFGRWAMRTSAAFRASLALRMVPTGRIRGCWGRTSGACRGRRGICSCPSGSRLTGVRGILPDCRRGHGTQIGHNRESGFLPLLRFRVR